MSEVGDACQVVMVSGRIIATSATLSLKMFLLMMKIYNTLYLGKWKGNTSFKRFRDIKGEDYEFINVCTEDPEKLLLIEREMEAHNLLFAKLPDLCGGDGNTQYVVARSDMHIFAAFLMDHSHGKERGVKVGPINESDYARTAVHPESGKYTEEFQDLNASAKEAWQERRLQLTTAKVEKPLQLPLFSGRIYEQRTAKQGKDPDRTDPEHSAGVDINASAVEEPEVLRITRYGRREEITLMDLLMDPQLRLRNEILRRGAQLQIIYEEPIREGEKWAAFPVHDGEHIVIVPREDLLTGNTTREKQVRAAPIEKPPKAMLYTNKNYVVMDLRSGEKSICDGQHVIDLMKGPTPAQQKQRLENLTRNIEKNAGVGNIQLPATVRKHGGR